MDTLERKRFIPIYKFSMRSGPTILMDGGPVPAQAVYSQRGLHSLPENKGLESTQTMYNIFQLIRHPSRDSTVACFAARRPEHHANHSLVVEIDDS